MSCKSVADAALTRTVSKDTTSARMNRWTSVLDIHGGAFTPVLWSEMQYSPGAKREGRKAHPHPTDGAARALAGFGTGRFEQFQAMVPAAG